MGLTKQKSSRLRAFTLLELLVVVAIIAILAAILLPIYGRVGQQANVVKTLSNMKQMGVAFLSYANDNNYMLPNRALTNADGSPSTSKWPTLLQQYVQNLAVYTSPIPDVNGKTYKVTNPSMYSNPTTNYTSYIYNGMNDLGAFQNETVTVRINLIALPSQTILLGIPLPQTGQFYMDFVEGAGNNNDVLNKTAFPNGTVYVFCDGSSRLLVNNAASATYQKQAPPNSGTYTDWLWLINKSNTGVIQ